MSILTTHIHVVHKKVQLSSLHCYFGKYGAILIMFLIMLSVAQCIERCKAPVVECGVIIVSNLH